jgi:hypothetical protein
LPKGQNGEEFLDFWKYLPMGVISRDIQDKKFGMNAADPQGIRAMLYLYFSTTTSFSGML